MKLTDVYWALTVYISVEKVRETWAELPGMLSVMEERSVKSPSEETAQLWICDFPYFAFNSYF